MESLRQVRGLRGLSQRELAARAGLSFRGWQLLERRDHDARIGSLEKAAGALGLPPAGIRFLLDDFFRLDPLSIRATALRIALDGPDSWPIHLMDFVDAFRRTPDRRRLVSPPVPSGSPRPDALIAATADQLCSEAGLPAPAWCDGAPGLAEPWFVSGVENLKAIAIAESPTPFRRRNVFVLGNFLARA